MTFQAFLLKAVPFFIFMADTTCAVLSYHGGMAPRYLALDLMASRSLTHGGTNWYLHAHQSCQYAL
jgi:hypothetical protein